MQLVEERPPVNVDKLDPETMELEAKHLDLLLKKLQLEQVRKSTINWSIVLPVMSGVLAALIGVIVAYLNGRYQFQSEHYKSQTTLIVEAVKTGTNNPLVALTNLQFFANAGLLDPKVVEAVKQGKFPVLPAATARAPGGEFQSVDRDLRHLHPLARSKVGGILAKLSAEGIPIKLYEGFRDPMHQQYFYSQGRITKSPIRTDDPPWRSFRQYGLAVTFGVYENDWWSWDYDDPKQQRWWDRLKTLAQNEGLDLMGTGSAGFRVAGIKLDDLIAGRYPEGDQSWADNLSRAILNWAGEPAAPPAPVSGPAQLGRNPAE